MVTIGIKTKESLHTIKSLDRAEGLTKKMKNGGLSVYDEASRQVSDDDSERDYGNSQLDNWSENGSMMAVRAADRFGRWGIRTTAKNIRNRRMRKSAAQNVKSGGQKLLNASRQSQQKLLNAPKSAEKAAKTAQQTAKATAKTAKATAKAAQKAAQAAKAAVKATVKGIKIAVKAVIAAVKATVAAIKGIIAAIAAGGWVAVVIILVICMVALVVGSVFAIFIPNDSGGGSGGISAVQTVRDSERTFYEQIEAEKAEYNYDMCFTNGTACDPTLVIAVYAVKENQTDEVATFDEKKAGVLRDVYSRMNNVSLRTEVVTVKEKQQQQQSDGTIKTVELEVQKTYLYVDISTPTVEEIISYFGFDDKQVEQLQLLLSDENADLWNGILGDGR